MAHCVFPPGHSQSLQEMWNRERKSRERLLLILYKMHEHNHEDVIYSLFFPCFTCVNRKCLHDGIHLPQYISPPNNTCSEVCLMLFEIITQNYIVAFSLGTPVCFSIGFYWITPSYVAKTKSERSLKRRNMLPSYRVSVSTFGSNTSSMVMSDHLWLPLSWTGCECMTDRQSESVFQVSCEVGLWPLNFQELWHHD